MLNDIAGIKIKGANFQSETALELFKSNNKNVQATLIYGRNGAGKSTIAKAFRKVKDGKPSNNENTSADDEHVQIQTADLFDTFGKNLQMKNNECEKIHIFDEDFIDKNVKLQKDGINTIVMVGKNIDLTGEIEKKREKLKDEQKDNEKDNKEKEKLTNEYNECLDEIKTELRNNWAENEKEIKDLKRKPYVSEKILNDFIGKYENFKSNIQDNIELKKLKNKFNDKLNEKNKKEEGANEIKQSVPSIKNLDLYKKFDVELLNRLLNEKIPKPNISVEEKEKEILDLLLDEKHEGDELEEKLKFFSNNPKNCPYCYSSLSIDYDKSIVNIISEILNKERKENKEKLNKLKLAEIDCDLQEFKNLPSYKTCEGLLNEINREIKFNNKYIENKIGNPYEIINSQKYNVKKEVIKLTNLLEKLESERQQKNKSERNTTKVKNELVELNFNIAYYKIRKYICKFKEKEKAIDDISKLLNESDKKIAKIKEEINEKNAQYENVDDAVNQINEFLSYIFFSKSRLKLEFYSKEKYKLLSNGNYVHPGNVSLGERNIIGLCYFFVKLMEGKDKNDAFKEPCLIVVDDPISSFDQENKVGILSFFKYILNTIICRNDANKVLILTHDFSTFSAFDKIMNEIKKSKKIGHKKNIFNEFKLIDSKLEPLNLKHYQQYDQLLNKVYNFADGNDNDEQVIGNIMRQLIEAFVTFEYEKGINEVINDSEIMGKLPRKLQSYFDNLICRIVLNEESHKEDDVKSMKDLNFYVSVTDGEKRAIAKSVLGFMWLLNKGHVIAHLESIEKSQKSLDNLDNKINCKEAETKIKSWIKEFEQK